MKGFSEKVYLSLKMPTEDVPLSDQTRILLALQALGYENVTVPLSLLRKLYPLCRNAYYDITVSLVRREQDWVMTHVQAGDQTHNHYGLAVDYGSTTIVMRLVDMNSGAVVGEEKTVTGQVEYGTDILSRITYTLEDPSHRNILQKATADTFHRLFDQLRESTGIEASQSPVMILSGNTTMIHFLLGLDAWTVFAAPYSPVVTRPGFFFGHELGMDFDGLIYIIPAASNYVGGDIISGLMKLDIHKKDDTSLFFDIGTNGELVIGNKEWMVAGAGAAGPALEGYISRFGMRAAPGAIDKVFIEQDRLRFTTIGHRPAVGICGSGIISLLAQMRLNGWINIAGELDPHASDRIVYLEDDGQYAAVYAWEHESADGQRLFFSQQDIHQYLDTKAAAHTMITSLLSSAGIEEADLSKLYLSGAFAAHCELEDAITIGIFPDVARERYQVISNTSLEGATVLLLDRSRRTEAEELAENIYCVQFASIPDFMIQMQAAKFIPHTDMNRYPSIKARLA